MVQTALDGAAAANEIESVLRAELDGADRAMANTRPILRHLLRNDDHSIFSDEVIARVRGLIGSVAEQLVLAISEAADRPDPRAIDQEAVEHLFATLLDNPAMVAHAHALAVEWQLTERLQGRLALDPVLSPLLQSMIASGDATTSAMAMALLAAQARFTQSQRRMELPLGELPPDLFYAALVTLRVHSADDPGAEPHAARAEEALRMRYEERRSRLGLIERLITALRGEAERALSLEEAGVAIFLTALSVGSGHGRDAAVLTTSESQAARLALALTACGLKADAVAAQFLALHPAIGLPAGMAALRPDRAAAILADAGENPDL